MAAVPYEVTPPDAPTAAPDAYQRIATPGAAFGDNIAQGAEQLGAGALTAARFYQQVSAQDQANKWEDETNKILYGDPNKKGADGTPDQGYYGLRGQAALDAMPRVRQQIQELRDRYKGDLSTGEQTSHFDQQTFRLNSYLMNGVGRHYDTQFVGYGTGVADASYDLAVKHAAQFYNDPAAVERATQDAIGARLRKAQVQGLGLNNDVVEDIKVKATADVLRAQVQAMSVHDKAGAMAEIEKNREKLGTYYEPLARELKAAANHQTGNDVGTYVFNRAAGVTGPASDDLWGRIKGVEGGVGPAGEARTSPKGAVGISQILPETAKLVAGEMGVPYDEARLKTDQAYNESLGRHYLGSMLARYGGNEMLAAAAYNAGPGRVDTWIARFGDPRAGAISDQDFADKIPIAETKNYVRDAGTLRGRTGIAPPAAKLDVASGDSIGVQQIRNGLGGKEGPRSGDQTGATAVIGENPQQVLDRVNKATPETFAGKTVFHSSGASNAINPQTKEVDPQALGPVADQVRKLLADGAANVVVPGVGPGVKNRDAVNQTLRTAVEGAGGKFFVPDVKWAADGIHPAEVAKVRDQALAALGTGTAKPLPAAAQSPPQERSLADMYTEVDRMPIDAEAKEIAKRHIHMNYEARNIDRTQRLAAQREASEAAANGYITRILGNEAGQPIVDEIRNNPSLTWETKQHLVNAASAHSQSDVEHAARVYGPGFWDAYRAVNAAPGTPGRLTDQESLLSRAGPGGDLTLGGVAELTKLMQGKRTPQGEAEAKMQEQFFRSARGQVTHADEHLGIKDPKGEEYFLRFMAQAFPAIQAAKAAGKTAAEIYDPDGPIFKGIKPFVRPMSVWMNDIMGDNLAGSSAAFDIKTIKTPQEMLAAVRAGKITRDQAQKLGEEKTWLDPVQPLAPAAPVR